MAGHVTDTPQNPDVIKCTTITEEDRDAQQETQQTQSIRRGKCKWFNVAKGWGFITPEDGGQDIFVHQSVIQMGGFRSLGDNEDVEFECKISEKGLEATKVSGPSGPCHGSSFRPSAKKRYRKIRCYNCGEFANHIAAKCSLGPQPKRCHHCKSNEHLIANCPTKPADKQSTSQSRQTPTDEEEEEEEEIDLERDEDDEEEEEEEEQRENVGN